MGSAAQLTIIFTIYSFVGWVCETIFCSIQEKKLVDRGFLNGPFCPIYGFGGLIVITVLSPFSSNIFLLFFSSMIVTTAIEYLTGVVLEHIFHTTWWDYSKCKFNFEGRICLTNSLLFGVMCVVGIEYVHPIVFKLVKAIDLQWTTYLAYGVVVYFILDLCVTIHSILQLNGKLEQLQQVLDEIKSKTGAVKDSLIERSRLDDDTKTSLNSLYDKKDGIEKGVKFLHRRIIRAFPTMKSDKNDESLSWIKDSIFSKISKRK